MGFEEHSHEQVHRNVELDGPFLISRVNGVKVRCGQLTTPSLAELRDHAGDQAKGAPLLVEEVIGDVAALHRAPDNAGALFQAASQFNLLEMTSPQVTPEQGVGIYQWDRTQGPACAIVCGGGAIYRNYFVELDGQLGQRHDRQIDCLRELGEAFGATPCWEMQNGYALASEAGLRRVNAQLASCDAAELDRLRGLLEVGVQRDVEVLGPGHLVTQVYGSAMPVAYGRPPRSLWEPLSRLVLEASYEATLLVAHRCGARRVYLTALGGGVFGNDPSWIVDAMVRALTWARGLEVRLVSYGASNPIAAEVVRRHLRGLR